MNKQPREIAFPLTTDDSVSYDLPEKLYRGNLLYPIHKQEKKYAGQRLLNPALAGRYTFYQAVKH